MYWNLLKYSESDNSNSMFPEIVPPVAFAKSEIIASCMAPSKEDAIKIFIMYVKYNIVSIPYQQMTEFDSSVVEGTREEYQDFMYKVLH